MGDREREFLKTGIINHLSHSFIPQTTFTDNLQSALIDGILEVGDVKMKRVNGASKTLGGIGVGLENLVGKA